MDIFDDEKRGDIIIIIIIIIISKKEMNWKVWVSVLFCSVLLNDEQG